MTREQKYPNTETFQFYNANPKNRITEDCVYRAISTAMGIPYNIVVRELCDMMVETGYDAQGKKCIEKYLEKKGWIKCKQPKKWDNTKYTGKEFCKQIANKKKNYIAFIGGHHIVAIVNGKVRDIWDSTGGCIGNYWIKA